MISASAEAETHARSFFLIRVWAMPAALATYAIVGWLYGLEDAKVPLALQVITNVINIALDFLFVFGFGWGVAGVAAAGLIADLVGLVIAAFVIFRRLKLLGVTTDAKRVFDIPRMRRMLAINRDIFFTHVLRRIDVRDLHRAQCGTQRFGSGNKPNSFELSNVYFVWY